MILPVAYRAQAILEVVPERQPNAPADPITSAAADEIRLNTEAEKVGAEPVVRAVFKAWEAGRFGPTQGRTSEFRKMIDAFGNLIEEGIGRLCRSPSAGRIFSPILCPEGANGDEEEVKFFAFQGHLKVTAQRESRLIKVAFTALDPQVAAKVTNAVIAEYLNRHADQEEIRSSRYIDWLQGRMDALGARTAKSDEVVAQYRGRTGLVELAKDASSARLSPTVAELEHALQDLSSAEAALSSVRVKQETLREVRRDPRKINSAGEILGSKVLQDLKVQQALEQAKLAGVFATYSADSPATARARVGIATFQTRIDEEVQKLLDATEREYIGASALADRLSRRVEDLKARVAQEEIARVTLRGLERQANANSDLYTAYLRQAREAIEAASWQPVAASVVASATPPVEPRFPHNPLGPPLAIIGSAFAAIIIGARTELQRQQRIFRNALDFRELSDVRVVGAVPRVRRPMETHLPGGFRAAIESVAFRLLVPAEGGLPSVPALPMVPALPDRDMPARSGKSLAIAVTSAVTAEGKTVLAGSLAKHFLATGARVLIIDADVRRPTVVDFIRGAQDCPVRLVTCGPDGAMQCEGHGKGELHVLKLADMGSTAGINLAALPRLISNLKQHYGVLIIDTPPLLVVSDALAIVPECDRIVFVVRWCSTRRDAVELALHDFSSLERARTRVVLTCVENRPYA
jgi:uncharacterized protein involved in exopolysaccharide biosynthesis/Mrp family chromosome partitioning ATPase